jgi:hypothetical protein
VRHKIQLKRITQLSAQLANITQIIISQCTKKKTSKKKEGSRKEKGMERREEGKREEQLMS